MRWKAQFDCLFVWWCLMPQYFSYIVAVSFIGQGTQVSSTNKTDCHDITEILLKVVLSTINHNHFDVIVVTKMLFWHVFLIFFFSFYDTTIVFVAAGVTCLVCLSISLFAIQTKVKQKLRPSRWCYSYSHPLDKVVR